MKKSEIPNTYIESFNNVVEKYGENGGLTYNQFMCYIYDTEFGYWADPFENKDNYFRRITCNYSRYLNEHNHLPEIFDHDLFIGFVLDIFAGNMED